MRVPILFHADRKVNRPLSSKKVAKNMLNVFELSEREPEYFLDDAKFVVFTSSSLLVYPAIPISREPFAFALSCSHLPENSYKVRLALKLHSILDDTKVTKNIERPVSTVVIVEGKSFVPLSLEFFGGSKAESVAPIKLYFEHRPTAKAPILLSGGSAHKERAVLSLTFSQVQKSSFPLLLLVESVTKEAFLDVPIVTKSVLCVPIALGFALTRAARAPIGVEFRKEGRYTESPACALAAFEETLSQKVLASFAGNLDISARAFAFVAFEGKVEQEAFVFVAWRSAMARATSSQALVFASFWEPAVVSAERVTFAPAFAAAELEEERLSCESTVILNPTTGKVRFRLAGKEVEVGAREKVFVPARVGLLELEAPIASIEDRIRNARIAFSGGVLQVFYEMVPYTLKSLAERQEFERCRKEKDVFLRVPEEVV